MPHTELSGKRDDKTCQQSLEIPGSVGIEKDQSWHFCVNYRKLNAVTLQDTYPLPHTDESLDSLADRRYFSTLDLTSDYWQVPLDTDVQEMSTFAICSSSWKWKALPFGLTSVPTTFQHLTKQVLCELHQQTLLLYLGDMIVIALDFDSHLQSFEEVFKIAARCRVEA